VKEEVLVSIICTAYNHESYVEDALKSFLMQKTDFKYEILIHDDASTDQTAQIIRRYEKAYPDLVKPIYQTVNQYSRGIDIFLVHQLPRAKGKYIAICEGDDFWTDCDKLQKQFEAMEAHPEINICSHAVQTVEAKTKKIAGYVTPMKENGILSAEKVIAGGGGFVGTNSLFIRRALFDTMPEFVRVLMLDYSLQIWGSLAGGMLYLNECMSAYRVLAAGSWTVEVIRNAQKRIDICRKIQAMLRQLDTDTHGAYRSAVEKCILENRISELSAMDRYKDLLGEEFRPVFCELPLRERIKIRLKAYFPWLLKCKRYLDSLKKRG